MAASIEAIVPNATLARGIGMAEGATESDLNSAGATQALAQAVGIVEGYLQRPLLDAANTYTIRIPDESNPLLYRGDDWFRSALVADVVFNAPGITAGINEGASETSPFPADWGGIHWQHSDEGVWLWPENAWRHTGGDADAVWQVYITSGLPASDSKTIQGVKLQLTRQSLNAVQGALLMLTNDIIHGRREITRNASWKQSLRPWVLDAKPTLEQVPAPT